MTLAQIKSLGARIIRAIDGKDRKTLAADVANFVSALAVVVDKRRPPALSVPKAFSVEDLAQIRKHVGIECRYLSEEPVDHQPPSTGSVLEHLEARVLARSRLSFDIFLENCGEFPGRDGKVEPMVCAPMHRRWSQLRAQHKWLLLVAHINSAKSTLNSVFYPVWLLGRNPNLRIALIGNTSARSGDLLRACADLITSNDNVKKTFPHLKPNPTGPWSSTQLQVARSVQQKEASISSFGVRGAVQGNRFDVLICDDLVDAENSATLAQIEDLIGWFRSTCLTRLVPDGIVVVIGTPWRPNDLLAVLEQSGLFFVAKFPLLDPRTGAVTWPAIWSPEEIERKRASLKELDFARFCLCIARADSISAFKEAHIDKAIALGADFPRAMSLEDLGGLEEGAAIYVGVDLAATSTAKKRRDNSCVATIGVGRDGAHTLLHLESGRWAPDVIKQKIEEQQDRWAPKLIAVEANGTQSLFTQELRRAGIPVQDFITSNTNKHDASQGVEAQAITLQNGQYRIPKHVAESAAGRALVHGWLFYDRHGHMADEVSAAWIAWNIARADRRAARVAPPTVGLRIVDGTGATSGANKVFSDEKARDDFYARKAAEQEKREGDFNRRINNVPDVADEQIADGLAARRDRRAS